MSNPEYTLDKIEETINLMSLKDISDIFPTLKKEAHLYSREEIRKIYNLLAEKIIELKFTTK